MENAGLENHFWSYMPEGTHLIPSIDTRLLYAWRDREKGSVPTAWDRRAYSNCIRRNMGVLTL